MKPGQKKPAIALPTEPGEPNKELASYSLLIYGEKKVGKTSLAAQFPNCLMLMFEPGAKALRCYKMPMPDWPSFVAVIDLLEKGEHQFLNVCIDTIDIAYKRCFDWVCEYHGFAHPGDQDDWGKSWGKIRDEFTNQITRLLALPYGTLFISHDNEKEVTSRTGFKYHKIGPSMAKQANETLSGLVDCIMYYRQGKNGRELVIDGTETITAGIRLGAVFFPQGIPDPVINMGRNAQEAYQSLLNAFNEKSNEVKKPERKGLTLRTKPGK